MSVVPVERPPGVRAAKRKSFWHRLALALDQHLADRSRRGCPLRLCAAPNTTSIGAAG